MPIRVLLADQHTILRQGLRCLLQRQGGMEVVAEAGDGREAVSVARRLHPDVVVMEVNMPRLSGREAARRIRKLVPVSRVIALSASRDDYFVVGMLQAGASGYLLKTCDVDELSRAIREIMKGHTYLTPEVAGAVVKAGTAKTSQTEEAQAGELTAREREVLQLLAAGYSAKEMAYHLSRSAKTVAMHRMRIMNKLRIYSLAGLTKYAIRCGLASVEG